MQVRQRHAEEHDRNINRADDAQRAIPAGLLERHLGELQSEHREIQKRAPADFVQRRGRRPGDQDHPNHPRTAKLHHEHGDRAGVAEKSHEHGGAQKRVVAVHAKDLH